MDEQTLGIIGITLFILVIFGLPIFFLVRGRIKIKRIWSELAKENKLDVTLGRWPYVKGKLEGRSFEMGSSIGRTSSGRASLHQSNMFYIKLNLKNSVPQGLVVGKRGRLQEAGPVRVNNIDFNKKIWTDCPDINSAQKYLTPGRQNALIKLVENGGILKGPENGDAAFVFYSRSGYRLKRVWLEEKKKTFLALANLLDA